MNEKYIIAPPKSNCLPIYAITIGANHVQEKIIRPNGSHFHHILFVQDGEGAFEVSGEKFLLKAGTAVFVSKNMPINYYSSGQTFETAWITFDGYATSSIFEYFSAKGFSYIENSQLISKILAFIKCAKNGDPFEKLSRSVYDIVLSYFSELNKNTCPPALSNAKLFVEQNYKRDLSVAEIAASVGASQSLLFKLFKEFESCTPIEYLRKIRIENAKILLSNRSDISIKNIGMECGFFDTSYFVKVFKAETEITPKKFRDIYKI